MSEAKSFMQKVDEWTQATIIEPLFDTARDFDDTHTYEWDKAVETVKKAIREKVLESYRNGIKAGAAKPARKEPRYAQAKTR